MNPPAARESDWYNDFYRAVQVMGPWYYFAVPYLRKILKPSSKLLELGCGQGHVLRYLVEKRIVGEQNLYAIDQSSTAVEFVRSRLPSAHVKTGDIYTLDHADDFFDVVLLMETIEHLEHPEIALKGIKRVIAPGGYFIVSFPNFLHLPWLIVRLLAEKLNRPNWIVLQPVDKIYTVFSVIKLLKRNGFVFECATGSNYGPPVLYPLEKEWVTRLLNSLHLWWISFHPILVFRKPPVNHP